jgi:Heterokaryon incompatibility protein (HET)
MIHLVRKCPANFPEDLDGKIVMRPKCHENHKADVSLIQSWLEECIETHKKCNEITEQLYPTRLLYLDHSSREVRLVITKDHPPKGQYITLSHRWGKQTYAKLESSTMTQLQNAVDVVSLPYVFQDAIKIAYELKIQYLWIDSLCIKQDKDDKSDWAIESLQMEKVYSYAFLNLSATLSIDGTETLFQPHTWDGITPSEIELEINGGPRTYFVLDGRLWDNEIHDGPLNGRGWVYQERFLARRVVHFGRRQVGWECRELDALEMLPKGIPQAYTMSYSKKSWLYNRFTNSSTQAGRIPILKWSEEWKLVVREYSNLDWSSAWQHAVTEYSKCQLTESDDKLIAFAGVAKFISRYAQDCCVAGMLQNSLVYDLAWWRYSEHRQEPDGSKPSSCAPSWSWASVDGEINFPSTLGLTRVHFVKILEISKIDSPEGPSLGGNSSILAEAACLPVRATWLDDEIIDFSINGCRFSVTGTEDPRSSLLELEGSLEEMQSVVRQGRALFMPLFASAHTFHGIILTKSRGVGVHRRIGAAQIQIMVTVHSSEEVPGVLDNGRKIVEKNKNRREIWLKDTSTKRGVEGTDSLNLTAIRLMRLSCAKKHARIIKIL